MLIVCRKMLKIDVNKSGRIFDFLVQHGYLRLTYDPSAPPPPPQLVQVPLSHTKSAVEGSGNSGIPVVQADCALPRPPSGQGGALHGNGGVKVNGTG
jgi:transcriptional adapter 2-alpha